MYNSRPGLVIAFHGCEADTCNALLTNPDFIKRSEKPYDWLGHGMYFWENNIDRALEWAKGKKRRGEIRTPAVIGAVLDLGYCFDLTDSRCISMIKVYHSQLSQIYRKVGEELPQNKDSKTDQYKDKILRELDCKVIEFMHDQITNRIAADVKLKSNSEYQIFDSVRGVFTEGGPVYAGAGIAEKTHIQLSIRNPNCIKGFFLPRQEIDFLKSCLPKN